MSKILARPPTQIKNFPLGIWEFLAIFAKKSAQNKNFGQFTEEKNFGPAQC